MLMQIICKHIIKHLFINVKLLWGLGGSPYFVGRYDIISLVTRASAEHQPVVQTGMAVIVSSGRLERAAPAGLLSSKNNCLWVLSAIG